MTEGSPRNIPWAWIIVVLLGGVVLLLSWDRFGSGDNALLADGQGIVAEAVGTSAQWAFTDETDEMTDEQVLSAYREIEADGYIIEATISCRPSSNALTYSFLTFGSDREPRDAKPQFSGNNPNPFHEARIRVDDNAPNSLAHCHRTGRCHNADRNAERSAQRRSPHSLRTPRRSCNLGSASSFSPMSATSTKRVRISVEADLIRACRGPRLAAAAPRPVIKPSTKRMRDWDRAPICSTSFCENTNGGEISIGQLSSVSVAIRETSIRSLPLVRVMTTLPSPSTPRACSRASLPIASDEEGAPKQKRINSITELLPVPRPPIRTFKPGLRLCRKPSSDPPSILMDSIHTPECLPISTNLPPCNVLMDVPKAPVVRSPFT